MATAAGPRAQTAEAKGLNPVLAAHADWSTDPRKRWLAKAKYDGVQWHAEAPQPVGDVTTLLARLLHDTGGAPVALGVDFPLGLPRSYAGQHGNGADNFPEFLRGLSGLDAALFFSPCARLNDVSPLRPFYPQRGQRGMTRAAHATALGLHHPHALMRACDAATAERPAGAPPFWTLGANQTGKAAISAWRDLILPAMHSQAPPLLWPFDGDFHALLQPSRVAIAETYPADSLRQLHIPLRGSKRRHDDRRAIADAVCGAMHRLRMRPDHTLGQSIVAGFGADAYGEDRFDCVLGLMNVVAVINGDRPDGTPDDVWIKQWEGWVLGQTALPRIFPHSMAPHSPEREC